MKKLVLFSIIAMQLTAFKGLFSSEMINDIDVCVEYSNK